MSDHLTEEERLAIQKFRDQQIPKEKPKRYTQKRRVRSYPDKIHQHLKASRIRHVRRPKLDLSCVSVQRALQWAFRDEYAQLDMPEREAPENRGSGFGMEYILIERAKLGGVQIDASRGTSSPHEDAETIAAIVVNLSHEFGGYRSAIQIAELSRSGLTPDWMPGAIPQIEPAEWASANQLGRRGKTVVVDYYRETIRTAHPKNPTLFITRTKKTEIRWTPCRWRPSMAEIENRRDQYTRWWLTLQNIRDRLIASGMLRQVGLNEDMPPRFPWKA